jgi:hypothetical protein
VLTERVIAWVDGHVTESPLSAEVQELVARYAPPQPAARRARYREAALMTAHGLVMIPFILGVALAGAISSRLGIHDTGVIYRIAVAGLTFCVAGTWIHLMRFYDAQVAVWRSRRDPARGDVERRWPRASSDFDFIAQAVAAAIAAAVA